MAKRALGRGLKALIPEPPEGRPGYAEVPLAELSPNPRQPRAHFDQESLETLAASLREHGVLQPLLVTQAEAGGYQILAGERRFRAATLAGIERVPVIVRERLDERAELELALVENLQRRDLTPLEEARAYDNLRSLHGMSQAEIAERVGIDRSTVANSLRLLKLSDAIQDRVESGALSAGHARALLSIEESDREAWAERAVGEALSVRQLEAAAAAARQQPAESRGARRPKPGAQDPNLVEAQDRLARTLGVPVMIRSSGRGGTITIRCPNQEELMRVFDVMVERS